MKTWAVAVLVLWAGMAGAAPDPWPGKSCVDYPKECRDVITVPTQTVCEQTMQAAMEAMEEFTYQGDIASLDAVYRSRQAELALEIERLNRRDAAKQLWTEAKQCWRGK